MKVLAFNCSPKMQNGLTAKLLTPFLNSMEIAGAKINLIYTKKLIIKPCRGCYKCWFLTPGKCILNDDMNSLLQQWAGADIVVIGTPLYSDGLPSIMKCILDRRLPLSKPYIIKENNSCHHMIRCSTENKKLVLLSTCGFWKTDNFNPLLAHIKAVCKNEEREFTAALLRPHSIVLENNFPMADRNKIEQILTACKDAGKELIHNGKISTVTLKAISMELMAMDDFIKAANNYFKEIAGLYRKVVKQSVKQPDNQDDDELFCY